MARYFRPKHFSWQNVLRDEIFRCSGSCEGSCSLSSPLLPQQTQAAQEEETQAEISWAAKQ